MSEEIQVWKIGFEGFGGAIAPDTAPPIPSAEGGESDKRQRAKRIIEAGENIVQWAAYGPDGWKPCGRTIPTLPPGAYTIEVTPNDGIIFVSHDIVTDDLVEFPDSQMAHIIDEIETFWKTSSAFERLGFAHRRGFLLYGPQGSGKTSLVALAIARILRRGGVAFLMRCDPDTFTRGLELFRRIEPERAAMCVFEDVDAILRRWNEALVLSLLDGESQINHVLNVASCFTPDVRLLTRDLRWVPCGDLVPGDLLWAFDEARPTGKGARRRYRQATILRSVPAKKECVRITLDTDESFICTVDHPWLSFANRQRAVERLGWTKAVELLGQPNLVRPFMPWKTETSWEAGWLAGILDGEGCVCRGSTGGRSGHVTIAQNVGPTADKIAAAIAKRTDVHVYERSTRRGMMVFETKGGRAWAAKLIGSVRAERLIEQFDLVGGMMHKKFPAKVVAVEPVGTQEIQSIQTDSQTYIAEGFASHNTNYPELLDRRIVARPRRFDRVIRIGMPTAEVRRKYLETKGLKAQNAEQLANSTEGLSLAALAEILISSKCLGISEDEAVAAMRQMQESKPSSDEFSRNGRRAGIP